MARNQQGEGEGEFELDTRFALDDDNDNEENSHGAASHPTAADDTNAQGGGRAEAAEPGVAGAGGNADGSGGRRGREREHSYGDDADAEGDEDEGEALIAPSDGYDLDLERGASDTDTRRDTDGAGQADSRSRSQRSSSRSSNRNKYPPLPPSYDDVLRSVRNRTSRWRTVREHLVSLPQLVPEGVRECAASAAYSAKVGVRRYWPSGRLAHSFLVLAGLWVLVVLTGPSFDNFTSGGGNGGGGLLGGGAGGNSSSGWSFESIVPYEPPPLPYKGDGHVERNASWALEGCVAEADPTGWSWWTWCYATANFSLTVPPSFGAGDKLFVYADPTPYDPSDDAARAYAQRIGEDLNVHRVTPGSEREGGDGARGSMRGTIRLVEEERSARRRRRRASSGRSARSRCRCAPSSAGPRKGTSEESPSRSSSAASSVRASAST